MIVIDNYYLTSCGRYLLGTSVATALAKTLLSLTIITTILSRIAFNAPLLVNVYSFRW